MCKVISSGNCTYKVIKQHLVLTIQERQLFAAITNVIYQISYHFQRIFKQFYLHFRLFYLLSLDSHVAIDCDVSTVYWSVLQVFIRRWCRIIRTRAYLHHLPDEHVTSSAHALWTRRYQKQNNYHREAKV